MRKRKKKIVAVAAIAVIGLAGCSASNTGDTEGTSQDTIDEAVVSYWDDMGAEEQQYVCDTFVDDPDLVESAFIGGYDTSSGAGSDLAEESWDALAELLRQKC